ncbi:MAG: amidohydrolase family protein [Gemmatimonadetes bacterium]|nr:amidohydrolase family protein [Gemmatimonadota bacterium]
MIRSRVVITLSSLALAASACTPESSAVAYTGATVWDGTGAASVANATIVVDSGRIVALGAEVQPPRGATVVELDGKYVIPGLINSHGHVTGAWAEAEVTDPVERVRGDLLLYARYGVTTVNSLGDEAPARAARDAASPTDARARILASGPVVAASDPAGARAAALANADAGANWLKLRVDDDLGAAQKMPWEAVAAVLEVGRERGLRVATHLFYLDDAKRLLDMGTGMLAHSVRDTDVDADFIDRLRASGVCYVPTLVRDVSTFVYAERPDWFDDPFFVAHANPGQLARASDPVFMAAMRESASAAAYRVALGQAQRNLKVLRDAGIPIAFGTDSGPAVRFPGYFEHMELQLMVDAGLTPAQALESATRVAAECIGMEGIGTLAPGNWADFLVLGADPLQDISATHQLERVYVGGILVP